MTAIRLAIIGAGIMGERMLRAAIDHAQGIVEVASVWDAAPAALDRLAPIMPPGTRAASARRAMEAADCVYVATPPATHLSYAADAVAAGCAVFLEKPLATDVEAARAFVDRHGTDRIAVNFPFASSFAVERLRTWLDEGSIGTPSRLDIRVAFATWPRPWQQAAAPWLDAPAEGGFTREVVSHFLFLSLRLAGHLVLTGATVDLPPSGTERSIRATLEAGSIPLTLEGGVGTTDRDDENSWTLTGPRGAVRLRDWSLAERRSPAGNWEPEPDATPNERMRPLVLRRQLQGVARMTAGDTHSLATIAEAFQVQAIVEQILASGPPDA